MEVANPELWDADHPNLYTMVVSLYDKEAQCHYESVSQNLGFRKLTFTSTQVSDDGKYSNVTDSYEQVKLNGKKLLIKGVNRHDTDPETGKYVSHEVYETDIQLMKQNNINAIRTSHYADDDYLYYLCDKYGLYVMCETNNESHALQNKEESLKKLETAAMSRQVTSYERFKNTTSNLFWSIGNESTQGKAQGDFANGMFAKMVAYFKDRDDTRMVHYEGLCSGVDAAGGVDMISHMYYPPSSVEAGTKLESQMPYLLCEYDHAMGNAVGSLSDYWNLIRSADNLMGGFIWDWVDQSRKIALKDGDWDYYAQENAHASGLNDLAGYYLGYGGDWNEEDGTKDANFCMNGLVSADRDPQPELKEVKYQYQDIWFTSSEDVLQGHKITISNESISKKLSEYQVVWELQEDGETVDSGVLEQEVLAGETKEVTVPYNLPEKLKAGAEYYLNLSVQTTQESIVGEAGYEIAYGQFKVDAETVKATREVASGVTITPDDGNYLVQGEDFEFTVNGNTGVMENYYYQGKLLIKEGPTVNFDRATTDNDKGVLYTLDVSKNLTMNGTPEISQDSMGRNVITVEWNIHREAQQGEKAPYTGDGTVQIQYVIEGNGAVGINLNYDLTGIDVRGKNDKFTKVGTIMTLAEDSEAISWYGNGDGESYSDRCSYTRVGTYTSTVSDMYYPFAKPQDCGNLTGVRWISVANQDTGYGVLISAADEVNASALHFTPSDLAAADHTGDLTPSKETYLTIDTAVAGIGNSSCGFEALEQYRVTDKVYAYSYTILPVTKTTDKMSTALGYRSDVEVTGGADAQVTTPSVDTTAAPVTETAAPNASVTETAVPGGTETIGTVAVTSPKKVSGVKVKASGKKKLTVQWKNGSKVSYKVAYSTDKKQLAKLKNGSTKAVSGVFVADAKKNRVILKKLKTGKKYYVKVCAYTKENGVITAGNWSAVKVKKVK
jgi:beta-galactosidase